MYFFFSLSRGEIRSLSLSKSLFFSWLISFFTGQLDRRVIVTLVVILSDESLSGWHHDRLPTVCAPQSCLTTTSERAAVGAAPDSSRPERRVVSCRVIARQNARRQTITAAPTSFVLTAFARDLQLNWDAYISITGPLSFEITKDWSPIDNGVIEKEGLKRINFCKIRNHRFSEGVLNK